MVYLACPVNVRHVITGVAPQMYVPIPILVQQGLVGDSPFCSELEPDTGVAQRTQQATATSNIATSDWLTKLSLTLMLARTATPARCWNRMFTP